MTKLEEILGAELFNTVSEKLKGTDFSLEGKVPYERFSEVNTKKSELLEQVARLQDQIDKLTAQNEKLTKDLSAQNITTKIDEVLRKSGARNIETLKKILDWSNVQDTEDSLKQFTETVNKLKQDEPYLFSNNEVKGNLPQGDNTGTSISKEDFHKMTYEEKAALFKRDKSLYDTLKG